VIDWTQIRRVLLVRLRSIGDTVLMTPCLTALKQFRPELHVAVLLEQLSAQLLNGHPQVVPVAMHFLKKYYSSQGVDDLILQVAGRPDAKKYWQSHAIMAFMKSNQKEKAIQIAQASPYKQIKRIGKLLVGKHEAKPEETSLPSHRHGQ